MRELIDVLKKMTSDPVIKQELEDIWLYCQENFRYKVDAVKEKQFLVKEQVKKIKEE